MEGSKNGRLILLIVIIIGIWIFAYNRYQEYRPPDQETSNERIRPDMGERDAAARGRPDTDRREQGIERIREIARNDLNMTREQERRLEEAFRDETLTREQRREVFEQVLTPQQREQVEQRRDEFRARMAERRSQMEQRSERLLSDSERREMREMIEARIEARRARGGGRRGER